jgi:PAS domain S-box-containing protein
MKNNTDTGGKSRYYKVREDMTAGELVVETGRFDPRTRPWYKAAKESGKTSFSPLYKHFVLDDLTVSVGTPVYDKEGSLIGVLGTHITLSRMDQYLNDIVKRNGASAVIVDKNTGELVANSLQIPNFKVDADGSLKMTGINEINNSSIIRGYENYLANNDEDHVVVNGESSHINISEFKTTGVDMLLITSIPDAILTRDIYETIRLTIIFSTIIMLTLSFLYISYVGNLLKPLESLNLSAKKLNDGNFDERAKIFREDEIGKLAATFNMLAATIGSHVEDLETKVKDRTEDLEATNTVLQENREQLKLILDSTAEGIYGMDTEGLCTFCNESALRMLGYSSQEELLGKNMHFQIHHTRRDGTPFPLSECKIMESFKNGRGVYVDDEIFWRKDGTFFDVRYSSYPQYRDGKMVGSVITFMDNTERKKNEGNISFYIRQAQEYLEENFDSDITVAQVAGAVNLSEGYLQRLYKKEKGISMMDKVLWMRIEKAKLLLENSTLPVIDVAVASGFNSRQHFSSTFTRLVGCSPAAWRKSKGNIQVSEGFEK